MPSSGTYRVAEKKCAICAYWTDERQIQFVNNKQYYVKAISGLYDCKAQKGRRSSAVTYCLKWRKWPTLEPKKAFGTQKNRINADKGG